MTLEQITAQYQLLVLAPEIILTLFALAVLLAGAFFPDEQQRRSLPLLALAGALLSGVGAVRLWDSYRVFGPRDTAIYAVDNFSLFFKLIFLFGLVMTVAISGRFLQARSGDRHTVIGEYYALLMLGTVGMMMVASARDLLVVFLGIETLSVALYILAGFARQRLTSNEAAVKYLLLGAFATGFMLFGIALIYYAAGTTLLPRLTRELASGALDANSPAFLLGVALLLIGLAFKAALVPFHQWTPDVYEGSPTPVAAFMAVGAKAAAFSVLLRILPFTLGASLVSPQWHRILIVMAVLTMTIGNLVAMFQDSLKRLLAWSSIAHAGYALIGVIAAGSAVRQGGNPEVAAQTAAATLFYLTVYAVMNLGAFGVLVFLENQRATAHPEFAAEDDNLQVRDLAGLAARQPWVAAALALFLVSLAGIPPTAGFLGKLYVFQTGMQQGLIGLLLVGAVNTVISFYPYSRPIVAMYMQDGEAPASLPAAADNTELSVKPATDSFPRPHLVGARATVAVCAALTLGMIVLQGSVLEWARQAAILDVIKP